MIIAQALFFFSLFMIFYVYFGYPIIVIILGKFKNKIINKRTFEPFVSVIIPAFNEEENIKATIQNKLDLDYPKDKLEIIVISDGSTDKTEQIVESFEQTNVCLLRQGPRAGKTAAINLAIPLAKGEIVIFSDANSLYAPNALKAILSNFADDNIGYVTGKMIYTNPDGTVIGDGCSTYMKYENFLRKKETRIGSIVGVDGGIDAVRTELFIPMQPDQLPDFVLPLSVVEQGYRVVYEPNAVLKEATLNKSSDEYRMRVRVSLRALWAIYDKRALLISKNILFTWQLFSHKIARYLCFIFLFLTFICNIALYGNSLVFQIFFYIQIAAYFLALLSPLTNIFGVNLRFAELCYYFSLINFASAHAFFNFLRGKKQVLWTPRKG